MIVPLSPSTTAPVSTGLRPGSSSLGRGIGSVPLYQSACDRAALPLGRELVGDDLALGVHVALGLRVVVLAPWPGWSWASRGRGPRRRDHRRGRPSRRWCRCRTESSRATIRAGRRGCTGAAAPGRATGPSRAWRGLAPCSVAPRRPAAPAARVHGACSRRGSCGRCRWPRPRSTRRRVRIESDEWPWLPNCVTTLCSLAAFINWRTS